MKKLPKRIIYALNMLYRHRHQIAQIYLKTPTRHQLKHLIPLELKQRGIEILVFDFDGVLAAHGETIPIGEITQWLQECIAVFGAEHIFILTNKPLPARIAHFRTHYPKICFISEVRKKPYPDGLEKIMKLSGQPAHTVMLVDDRLLTGILAACIAQVQTVYITKPYTNIARRPLTESFFMVLRFLERRMAWILARNRKGIVE